MKPTALLTSFILALAALGCGNAPSWHKTTFLYFDTVCEVQVFCPRSVYIHAREDIDRIFADIDRVFAPGKKEYSTPEVRALFALALEIHRRSQGCFDITVAPLSELWGFHGGPLRIPTPEAQRAALQHVGMTKIKFDETGLSVPASMALDWGGIAKGYGIDQAAQALKARGIARGFLNAGGDMFCWGSNPQGRPWQIGIKHPREEGYAGVLSIRDLGAATTGDYQRYFMQKGVRYHHVFDPRTGFPARGKQSVTVVGPETSLCDALSTALFVSESPEKILARYPEYGAFLVYADGEPASLGKPFPFRPGLMRIPGTISEAGPNAWRPVE
jgi:thiamine biosynthesis lipoprotein